MTAPQDTTPWLARAGRWRPGSPLFILALAGCGALVVALGALGGPRTARERVEALLSNDDPWTSEAAWRALGPEALAPLVEIADEPQAPTAQRLRAVAALAYVEGDEATARLSALVTDEGRELRYRAVAALALSQRLGALAVPVLQKSLKSADVGMRQATAKALAAAGGDDAKTALEAQLDAEEELAVREVIQRSLTQLMP